VLRGRECSKLRTEQLRRRETAYPSFIRAVKGYVTEENGNGKYQYRYKYNKKFWEEFAYFPHTSHVFEVLEHN
jgi:hypothetical protein